ncbi:beta-propeller fold lactonase family protein [Streptomyces sp. A7024]|uniref:Beta-propeller fold lactonase family protein n=1 Tax=Streptomyces coryli TaxID=1128680 RepID=A0A6G4U305_9ACTN|nr:YncE family protein [Streptomyces coryli]NGN66544.1 beta-propeller fold lactonase family protein [Streptomyces coryli]
MTPLFRRPAVLAAAAAVLAAAVSACGPSPQEAADAKKRQAVKLAAQAKAKKLAAQKAAALPGMPPVKNAKNIYSETTADKIAPVMKTFKNLVYVPNTESDTVSVIDPKTYEVIRTIPVGDQPQHVVPSWDMKTLWVNDDLGDTLTPLDPRTGKKKGKPVEVSDPYNLYFTPNGKYAVVMASMDRELVFRDPHTMKRKKTVPVDCYGVNHADFSPDGKYFIVSCEFSAELLKVDTEKMKVVAKQKLPMEDGMPQDVKVSPDGKTWYVADMMAHGMWVLNGDKFSKPKLFPTGQGAHGLYPSRDAKTMYVSNRGEGTVSVFDFAKKKVVKKWTLPEGGSPDMGGVSADGKTLWLSGRYDGEVYAIDTRSGKQLAKIPVGSGPHGLAVYPQPGRYSLGHTGIFR